MSKRILLIIFILVIVGGVGYFVWINNGQSTVEGEPSGFSFKNFFPFGNSEEIIDEITDNRVTDNSSEDPDLAQAASNLPAPKLRKVSDSPVASMILFNIGSTTYLRYIEKATGNIYEARGDILDKKRLTNTTIPKINRAFWLPQGGGVLAQTVDENDIIETSFISLKPIRATSTEVSVPYETLMSRLPTGIQELSVRPDGKKIIYYQKVGVSDWFTANPDGSEKKNVYQNNIQNWVPQWYSANSILLTTKASAATLSYGYSFNISNNQLSKVFGGFAGGSAKASADGKNFLVSNSGDSSNLFLVKGVTENDLEIKTLPEKCAWDPSDVNYIICGVPKTFPSDDYPDSWYQGLVSTDDLVERINVSDKFLYVISNPEKDGGEVVDIKEIAVSPKGNYAAFINKLDSSLWLLRIKE